MIATSPSPSRTGARSSGTIQASPRTTATSVSGASSSIRSDHGGSIVERSRNAPRARGPSSKSGDGVHAHDPRRSRMKSRDPAMDSLRQSVLTGGMITPGQTLENPVTGERFTFTDTAASTGGELLAFELALRPGGAVPIPHVHPIQTERFEVVAGLMRFRLGLRRRLAGPGDVVEVAPGVVHGFANAGDEDARVRVEIRPALAMEAMLAEVVAMAQAGRMTRRGLPAACATSPCSRAPTTARRTPRC